MWCGSQVEGRQMKVLPVSTVQCPSSQVSLHEREGNNIDIVFVVLTQFEAAIFTPSCLFCTVVSQATLIYMCSKNKTSKTARSNLAALVSSLV